MYSLVIDDVHANPVVKCVLHAVYILSERGPRSAFPPCSDVTGRLHLIDKYINNVLKIRKNVLKIQINVLKIRINVLKIRKMY